MFNWIYLFFGANKQKNVPTGVLTFSLLVKSTLMQKFKAIEEHKLHQMFPKPVSKSSSFSGTAKQSGEGECSPSLWTGLPIPNHSDALSE